MSAGKCFCSNKYKRLCWLQEVCFVEIKSCGRNEDRMKLNSTGDGTIWGKKTMSASSPLEKFSASGCQLTHWSCSKQRPSAQGKKEPSKLFSGCYKGGWTIGDLRDFKCMPSLPCRTFPECGEVWPRLKPLNAKWNLLYSVLVGNKYTAREGSHIKVTLIRLSQRLVQSTSQDRG